MAAIATLPAITNPSMRMPVKSKKQAGLFGMVAGGKKKLPGLSQSEAKESLRGTKVKKLPNALEQTTKKLRKMPTARTY